MTDPIFGQSLRKLTNEGNKVRVVRQGQDGTLERRDEGRQGEVSSLFVALTHPEVVLEQGVHDAADAERRLDHVWNDFLQKIN